MKLTGYKPHYNWSTKGSSRPRSSWTDPFLFEFQGCMAMIPQAAINHSAVATITLLPPFESLHVPCNPWSWPLMSLSVQTSLFKSENMMKLVKYVFSGRRHTRKCKIPAISTVTSPSRKKPPSNPPPPPDERFSCDLLTRTQLKYPRREMRHPESTLKDWMCVPLWRSCQAAIYRKGKLCSHSPALGHS